MPGDRVRQSRRRTASAGAEHALGVPLQTDYKRLVEAYGAGVFDETVWLLAPDADRADCNLVGQTAARPTSWPTRWASARSRPRNWRSRARG